MQLIKAIKLDLGSMSMVYGFKKYNIDLIKNNIEGGYQAFVPRHQIFAMVLLINYTTYT